MKWNDLSICLSSANEIDLWRHMATSKPHTLIVSLSFWLRSFVLVDRLSFAGYTRAGELSNHGRREDPRLRTPQHTTPHHKLLGWMFVWHSLFTMGVVSKNRNQPTNSRCYGWSVVCCANSKDRQHEPSRGRKGVLRQPPVSLRLVPPGLSFSRADKTGSSGALAANNRPIQVRRCCTARRVATPGWLWKIVLCL